MAIRYRPDQVGGAERDHATATVDIFTSSITLAMTSTLIPTADRSDEASHRRGDDANQIGSNDAAGVKTCAITSPALSEGFPEQRGVRDIVTRPLIRFGANSQQIEAETQHGTELSNVRKKRSWISNSNRAKSDSVGNGVCARFGVCMGES